MSGLGAPRLVICSIGGRLAAETRAFFPSIRPRPFHPTPAKNHEFS